MPGGAPGFAEQSAFGSNQGIINHARNVAIGETHIFSPVTVNQFSFGYNRIFDYITSTGTGTCESAKLGIPGANLGCPNGSTTCTPGAYSCGLVSTLMLGGYWSLGDRGYTPFQGGTNIFTVNDSLDVIRGKHDIKFGIEYSCKPDECWHRSLPGRFLDSRQLRQFHGLFEYCGECSRAIRPQIS